MSKISGTAVPASNKSDALWTKTEVAKHLSICPRSVDNLMHSRALAFVRIGRVVRFEPSAVESLKRAYRVNAS